MKSISFIPLCYLILSIQAFSQSVPSGEELNSATTNSSQPENSLEDKVITMLKPYLANRDFEGYILIEKLDSVLFSKGFSFGDAEFTENSKFMIGSISKTFTAEAVKILIDERVISEETNITDAIPKSNLNGKITFKHLLDHSSGLTDYYNIREFRELRTEEMPTKDFVDWINQYPLDFKPGKGNSYSNSGYNILAYAVETLSGKRYSEYLQQEIFDRMGMSNSGSVEGERPKGMVEGQEPGNLPDLLKSPQELDDSWLIGSGSVYSTAKDLLKWAQVVNKRIQSKEDWKPYGWGVRERGKELYLEQNGRIPGYSANLSIYPQTNEVVMVLSRIESDAVNPIAKGIADILSGNEVTVPDIREVQEASLTTLAHYTGVYKIAPGFFVTVATVDGGLGIATGTGENLTYATLDPLGNEKFFFRIGYTEVRFQKDPNSGKIKGLFWGESGPYPLVEND